MNCPNCENPQTYIIATTGDGTNTNPITKCLNCGRDFGANYEGSQLSTSPDRGEDTPHPPLD